MSFSVSGNARSCLPGKMNKKVFSDLGLIAKGKVFKEKRSRMSPVNKREMPFSIKVLKSWKGAVKGDRVKFTYLLSGGDGLPYKDGETYIIYADKKDGKFVTDGCMIFSFEMSKELKDFTRNPPYIDKNKPLPPNIRRLNRLLENHEEDSLNKLKKSSI